MATCRKKHGGFTYFGILITIALLGSSLAALGASWSLQQRRANEEQLIHVGQAFRRAIASYYNNTNSGVRQYPQTLDDLLTDIRGGKLRRHLREIYADPLTGRADWELLKLADGTIFGVASTASGEPLKKENFDTWEAAFANANCFCDWQFVYLPQVVGDSAN